MASTRTAIEWTEKTWNPTTGCTKVSAGCKHCYAERITKRFPNHFPHGFQFTLHPERLDQPRRWRKPSLIFVNSMSDLFHEEMPLDFLKKVFEVMRETPWHIYQVLTKRHKRLAELAPELAPWPENVWIGVSVENASYKERIHYLREVPAAVRFISFEPLIGPIGKVDLTGIHWIIVGGESGPKRRPIHKEWVIELRDQALEQGVAFFFKQWGGYSPKSGGRKLEGKEWNEMPQALDRHMASFTNKAQGLPFPGV